MFRSSANRAAGGVLFLLGAGLAIAQDVPVFRTDVNLVHVIATVKNKRGELVGALQKSDFEIYDNGVRQEIAVFQRTTEQPLSVALLIDVSGSTAKDLKYETDSAAKFLRALLAEGNPDDTAALYSFDYSVTAVRSFTHNYLSLENALKTVHGSGGTSLFDAIYLASKELESRAGRKVMIVISDGGNTTSSMDIQKALKAAQFADAVLYPIVVLPITSETGRNTGGEHSLIFMADGTGGRSFFPGDSKELDQSFEQVIEELRTQYFIGFYPRGVPLPKISFHTLEVRLKSPDLQPSARKGYYGEAEESSAPPDAHIAVTPDGRKKRLQK